MDNYLITYGFEIFTLHRYSFCEELNLWISRSTAKVESTAPRVNMSRLTPEVIYVTYPLLIGDTVGQGHSTHNFDDLCIMQYDTEAYYEQLISSLSRYARITKHMKREHFLLLAPLM